MIASNKSQRFEVLYSICRMSYGVSRCQYDERSYRQGRKTLCSVLPQNLEGADAVSTSAYPDSMKKMQKLFVYY